jgi:hypothetical protein
MTMTWRLVLKDLTPDEFTDRYRLTIEQFYSLLQRILAKRPKYRGRAGALDCRLKLASCLRYLAGGKARDVADLHGQRESIFYKHLDETIDAILATEWSTMRLPVYPWQRQQCHVHPPITLSHTHQSPSSMSFWIRSRIWSFKRSLQSSLPLIFDSASIKSFSCCALFIARSLGSTCTVPAAGGADDAAHAFA